MRKAVFVFFLLAVLIPAVALAKHRITILHFNDIHGHIEDEQDGGGVARIFTVAKEIEEENSKSNADTYLLFGGDAFSGTIISSEYRGQAEFDVLGQLHLTAMVVGNHEFDNGDGCLLELTSHANFPVLAANVYWTNGEGRLFKPFVEIAENPNEKVAIIGLTHPKTPTYSKPENVEGIQFTEPIHEIKNILPKVKKGSFKIALTHEGVKNDIELAKKIKGINVVIGGHDHVPAGEYCRMVSKTPVCQTPANGKHLGRLDFEVDGNKVKFLGSRLIALTKDIPEDPNVRDLIAKYSKTLSRKYDVRIATAKEDLKPTRGEFSKLGSIVVDSLKMATGADISFTNAGGLRGALFKGPITLRHVKELLPFSNKVVVIKMTGSELMVLFNFALSQKSYPLISSNVFIDRTGKTIDDIKIDDKPIDPDRIYTLATVDFLASGGSGYTMLSSIAPENKQTLDYDSTAALIKYLKAKKVVP